MAEQAAPQGITHHPIGFFARREEDETYTLVLEVPATRVTVDVAKGFASPEQVVQVLMDALTAPSVAEERTAALEEYMPKMNETIDVVNGMGDELGGLMERLEAVEAWAAAMQQAAPQNRPPVRPRIARPGVAAPVAPPSLRRPASVTYTPDPGAPVALPVHTGPNPKPETDLRPQEWTRENTIPHRPIAGVRRGPGSEG